MRLLVIIPARGGSVRVPRKNLAPLTGGHDTLVLRAVRLAASLPRWDQNGEPSYMGWIVSTDDVEIALAVTQEGELPYEPGNYAGNVWPRRCGPDGPMVDVLLEVLGANVFKVDAVLCLQPTSPLRTRDDVIGAGKLMKTHPEARSLVSVNEATGQRNGAIYITRVEMLRDGLVFDDDSLKYPMPASRSLDINVQSDLDEARRILGP